MLSALQYSTLVVTVLTLTGEEQELFDMLI